MYIYTRESFETYALVKKTFTLGEVYKQYYPRDNLKVANALALTVDTTIIT